MKKIKLLFSFFVCLTLAPQTGFASASGNAQIAQVAGIASITAAAVYYKTKKAKCGGWGSYASCVAAIMAVIQMVQSIKGASAANGVRLDLCSGTNCGEPIDTDFCWSYSDCPQDPYDKEAEENFKTALTTGVGYDDAYNKLTKEAEDYIKDAEENGYSVDTSNGTITGPNGQTTTFAQAAKNFPKDFGKKALSKVAGAIAAIKARDKNRGLASSGGASGVGSGGGVAFQDEYYDGLKSGNGFGKKKSKKNDKNSLLAGLSDKDAKNGGIGTAGDNIFGMVNRRYLKKNKSAEFLKK